MSDISISTDTVQGMSLGNQLFGPESVRDYNDEIASGINTAGGLDNREQAVAGLEVASRTQDYLGAGTDFSSSGTDIDIQQAVHQAAADTGIGTIADKIA
ncbi:hypothetical protein DND132_0417 [Pseudodesulfovibrio mercurii]|uniref:Uncharacterized protein n=1 Tax=Pseudodesulfovibrio mercurii TaxID=641491 RepID=F0JF78_9BACT|nr:hypothetical protein [Pseudodesulfovibrio mercurii]EGB13634.1 hypothetical protein DND132_0417 [Pseudodesulfovibrio mercurii]